MALKFRRGATVPALQPGEPFFDGETLHIGKLAGNGNKAIGSGLPTYLIVNEDLEHHEFGNPSYTISKSGTYVLGGDVDGYVDIRIETEQITNGEIVRIINPISDFDRGIGFSDIGAINFSFGRSMSNGNFAEFLIVQYPEQDETGVVFLYASEYLGGLDAN